MNQTKYIRFFGGIEMVRGAKTSLIYDLHRGGIYEIPTLLFDVFLEFKHNTIEEVKTLFKHEYDEGIDLYLNKLFDLELIFETSEIDAFPPVDYSNWDYPLKVSNAVLEVPRNNSYDLSDALKQLDKLGCAHLQLRLIEDGDYNFAYFLEVIEKLKDSRLKIIELIVPNSLFVSREELILFFNVNLKLARVIFHSAPENKMMESENPLSEGRVLFTKQEFTYDQPDYVSIKSMFYNIRFFSEAIDHNVALNRKVSIDKDGFFKNYLSHEGTFGNINETKIESLIEREDFQSKWLISNNEIEKCQDCQYKYACFSNSDIEKKEGKYFKVEDCGFDPYESKWSEELSTIVHA